MSTAAQHQANAANARLSTGPRTEAGKQASSRNALRHGLTSKTLCLNSEDKTAFDELRAALHAAHAPANDVEHAAVEASPKPSGASTAAAVTRPPSSTRPIAGIQSENPELDPDEAAAWLFLDPAYMKKMSLFLRYQTSIERAHAKAETALRRLQKERREAEAGSNGFVSQRRVRDSEAALIEAALNIPLPPLPQLLAAAAAQDAARAQLKR